MEIRFGKEYLKELYFKGKTTDKKHRLPSSIVSRYCRIIDILESVSAVEDLYRYNSLNYKVLVGDKNGVESVRVNDKYRVEFRTCKVVSDVAVTVCNIEELSNHYK